MTKREVPADLAEVLQAPLAHVVRAMERPRHTTSRFAPHKRRAAAR